MSVDYREICFVAIPYGTKPLGPDDRAVDFDSIYERVFVPAIERTPLPEGGTLRALRAKDSFFTGPIDAELFEYVEYSRFLVADITGLNPNVMFELAHRYRAQESGTALFHQPHTRVAFDLEPVRAFPYEYEPDENAANSRDLITSVLTDALKHNRVDSPIHLALRAQRLGAHDNVQPLLIDAENAIRAGDVAAATGLYRQALRFASTDGVLHFKLGLLLKSQGDWHAATGEFTRAIEIVPAYPEAHRELGIAQNKVRVADADPTGEAELSRALELNPDDFDALSSLGGILKREGRSAEALALYERAAEISRGDPYPLLNAIILRAVVNRHLDLDERTRRLLDQAEWRRRNHITLVPPYQSPWCFFDLAEIRMLLGDLDESSRILAAGIARSSALSELETHRDTLARLAAAGIELPGLGESITALTSAIARRQ